MKFTAAHAKYLQGIYPNHTVVLNGKSFNMVLPFGQMIRESDFKGETCTAKVSDGQKLYMLTLTHHEDIDCWSGFIYEYGIDSNEYISMHSIMSIGDFKDEI